MLVVPHLSPPMMIRFGSSRVAFAAAAQAALAVGGVALAGTRAHRLVGGVAGGLRAAICASRPLARAG